MKTHALIQGTQAWHDYRANHFNASDATAMLGMSPYKTRSELLHELATGQTPDIDPATQRRFDDGHRFEALARPLAEKIIGKDLYPVTGSEGKLSASFDGLTMAEDTAFEHKTLNDSLRYTPWDEGNGDHLPPQYKVQMEQQLLVSGAERVLFMASKWKGDELVEERHCWYASDPAIRAQIVSGWEQFAKDLAAYVPPEVIVPAKATPQMGLPAVAIKVTGSIALIDNLDVVGAALTAYIERINKKPETDQDFADLEATVKTLKATEEALDAAEAGALAQTDSIDAMRKTVALYRETARSNRLLVEKLVKAEKENRRNKLLTEAGQTLSGHIKGLNEQIGKPYMPAIQADFQGVIKGLKSLDSMKDKLDTEVASAKIAANEAAQRIQANLATMRSLAHEHAFLFADTAQLVLKATDDLTALVKSRIADHKASEAAKEEATRERIRAEEQAKAEKAAREKLAAEQAEAAAAELAAAKTSEGAELSPAAQALYEAEGAANFANAHPKVTHEDVVKVMMPATVRKAIAAPAPAATSEPTLKLGEIGERLGFTLTADFLKVLGYEATTVKAAKLFHEEDFPAICQALINHISEVADQFDPVFA